MTLFAVVGAGIAVRVACQQGLDRRSRLAWWIIGSSLLLLITAFGLFAAASNGPDPDAFPTPGDAFRLIFTPVMLTGLLALPRSGDSRHGRLKIVLDIGLVLGSGAMLMWYLVVEPVLRAREQSVFATLVACVYPVADLALITGAVLIMIRSESSSSRRPALLLAVAMLIMAIGDVHLSYQRSHGADGGYHAWQFVCWIGSCFLMALAASEQWRQSAAHEFGDDERAIPPVPILPYSMVGFGYGILLLVALSEPMSPLGGLVIGAVLTTALVVVRQIVTLRENHRLVMTDSLTGLANRALLRDRLARAMRSARRSGRLVAVLLIDLDGFKEINDSYGHEAGDEVLVAVSDLLRRAVGGSDLVARLGGDEFAVVVYPCDGPRAAEAIRERIELSMEQQVFIAGRLIKPRASIGVAVLNSSTSTVNDLLRAADFSMYEAKRVGGRTSR